MDRTPSSDRRTRAWIEVRAEAVRRNYRRVREAAGGDVGMIPMVKGDAYGLGADRMVTTLEPESPLAWGVATVQEGCRLRELGVIVQNVVGKFFLYKKTYIGQLYSSSL